MSKPNKKAQKTEKSQKQINELSEENLETVSGGIIAVLQPAAHKLVGDGGFAGGLVPGVDVGTVGQVKI
jgi:hypothetical protein